MAEHGIHLEYRERVAIVTLDRPERLNTFNEFMWSELERVAAELREKTPRAIVVTGSGDRAFSAGFDVNIDNPQVSGLIDAVQGGHRSPVELLIGRIRNAVDGFVSLPSPVIAAINGDAHGGGAELATRCDVRIMEPDAAICFSEVRLGLMPDWGGTPALTRLVGPARAADMILTARKVGAEEALSIGLINRISAPSRALDESLEMAAAIAENGPRAVRSALEVIRSTGGKYLEEALEFEAEKAVDLIATGECYHGISALLSKQKPEFPDI